MINRLIEKEILGKKYNNLSIKKFINRNKNGQLVVLAACICGNEKEMIFNNIKKGLTKSCGCVGNKTHKLSNTPEYRTWANILQKCHNPNHNSYKHYGGKGIAVCESWKNDFLEFYKNMGPRPKGCSLDRIDPCRGYEPGNCRWTDLFVQSVNKKVVIDVLKNKYHSLYKILKDDGIII